MLRYLRFTPWVLALLLLASCVTPTQPPAQPPVDESLSRMPEIPDLPPPDLSPVRGRTVVVDPGHGGPWPGAVSPSNGLREADVNLRVAMHLAGLLGDAGANVLLTRTGDAVPVPDSQPRDLAARAEMANRAGADAFLSVHHNADVTGSGRNDLEVFYKMDDDVASLDLAQQLTYQLAWRLRREAQRKLLLPGNYKVLREARVPAVLLESSYMTHPGNAAFLATESAVQAEALAIAAGLADYFRLNPPDPAGAELVPREGAPEEVVARFHGGLPVNPGSARVLHEDTLLPGTAVVEGNVLRWTPLRPLPNGEYTLGLQVRNAAGLGATVPVQARVNRPWHRSSITQRPPTVPPDSEMEVLFEVRLQDVFGLPVADGTPVRMTQPVERSASTKDGVARFYVPARDLSAGLVAFEPPRRDGSGGEPASGVALAASPRYRSMRVTDAAGNAVAEAVLSSGGRSVGVTTPEGWAAVPGEAASVTVARAGYATQTVPLARDHTVIALTPVLGGALHGKRIVLDPAFGGRSAGAIGPHGTRASDINLDVARLAAESLREAGADVILTRAGDGDPSEMQRVRQSDESGAEVLVSISFGGPADVSRALDDAGMLREAHSFVGHYPGSANGIRLAQAIAKELGIALVTPSVTYVVQQAAAPAVLVQPATVALPEVETRYRDPEARRAVAEGLARAIAAYFGPAK